MRYLTTAALAAIIPLAAVSAQTVSGPAYIARAGASDLYEIQSSRLVLASTANANLRTYANQMVQDHTKSTADVTAAARQAGLTVPAPRLEPMQARNIASLRAATGTARDRLYVTQQRASHTKALQLQQGYARTGTVPQLRQVATTIVPVVEHHLREVNAM